MNFKLDANSLPKLSKENGFLCTVCYNKCNQVKTCILGMMPGKRRRGRPRMQYIDHIKKWTRVSLGENVRLTEDRTAWRERSCAAGAANVRTDDAD